MLQQHQTGRIFLQLNNGAYLFVREMRTGTWNIPGGKVNKNESTWRAAVRELYEETGIVLYNTKFHIFGKVKSNNDTIYAVRIYDNVDVTKLNAHLSHEISGYNAYNPNDAIKCNLSIRAVKRLKDILYTIAPIQYKYTIDVATEKLKRAKIRLE